MARKHAKKYTVKQPVKKVVIKAAVQSREREVIEVPEGTDNAMAIQQDDGSTKYFVVKFKTVTAEVAKYVACGPTTKRGLKNRPEFMAPRGKSGAKTGPGGAK